MNIRKKLSIISFLSIMIITLPSIWALYTFARNNYLDKTYHELNKQIQASASVPLEHLRLAEVSLKRLAKELKHSLAQPPRPSEIAEFDALVTKDKFGVTRNNPALFDGRRQAGVFIPADVTLTDDVKRTKLRAMKLLTSYGQAALVFFDGVWFDQANKTSVIFWRHDADFIYKLPPDHDYTQTLWDTLASPKLNPDRVAKWTPAILESPVGVWVVSCVYPVDIDNKWVGVLGHDIALTELVNAFKQQDPYHNSQHFLLDAFGNFILAGPWQAQLEKRSGEFKPDLSKQALLKKLLQSKTESSELKTIHLQGKDYLALTFPIQGLSWKYIRLVSIDEVLAPMKKLFTAIAGISLLIGLLTTLLMYEASRIILLKPLYAFLQLLHDYGHGQRDIRFINTKNDEFGQMALTFNTMADNLTQQNATLIKSRTRYQQVVNSINEVIFKLDEAGRIQFINDAWHTLTGVGRYDCVNDLLEDYIHPDSQQQFNDKLIQLKQTLDTHYQCELKLLTTQHQSIWVEMNLQAAIEHDPGLNTSSVVMMGNLSDISDRKYRQITDDILYSLEQEAIQGQSIDYILSLFCEQLSTFMAVDLIWVVATDILDSNVIAAAGEDIINLHHYNTQLHEQLSTQQRHDIANSTQSSVLAETEEFDCIAIALAIPERANAIVLLHTQKGQAFSAQKRLKIERLVNKLAHVLQLAQDHKWMLLHRTAIEKTANAVLITDNLGRIAWCNHAFLELTGHKMEEIQGQAINFLNSGKQTEAFYQNMWQRLNAQAIWRGEIVNKRKDGSFYTAVETITPLVDKFDNTTHFIAVQEDISELKEAEEQSRFLATHDFLTELPNRYLFRERLQHAIDTAMRTKQQLAVLFIDLDGFKTVNDSLGHQTGDIILQQVAQRLTAIVRQSDTVARIGGDEFTILVEGFTQISDITTLSDKILSSFKQTFDVEGNHLKLTTSIGIAIYPDDNDNVDDLIRCADAAMYHAKAQGRDNCQSFSQEINRQIEMRLLLEHDLEIAISQDQLELYYQPQMDASTNEVIGMEALIRWNHPDKGQISPLDFIPFAEESGLIVDLGQWVLQHACQQAQSWHQAGYSQINISINVSVKQLLHSEFIHTVKSTLQQTQVDPNYITIELTESIMVSQPDVALKLLNEIKQLGIRLSIDDFGTGYSSLQYLRLLPLDELKIDQSFINDIANKEGMAIIETICNLGHSMKLSLIAEGVEDVDTVALLLPLGCHHIQGYLYSKPLTVTDANVFLADQRIHP